jgi:flagellar assembly protein FliH
MPESKITSAKHVLRVDDEQEFSHWRLPDITVDQSLSPSNMFGKKPQAHVMDEDVKDTPAPLTMAQLEEMRAIAEQEGFAEGKQNGYQEGLEQGRLEGLEQGHREGLAQGEQQGLEVGKADADALVSRFSHIVEQFEQPLSVLDLEIESELLGLVISLAKSVIVHELKTHPEHILAALRQGIDALPIKEQQIKIRVNSTDAALIGEFYSQEQLAKHRWELDIDPLLSAGDCIIDSVRSSVDLRLEQRIAQVLVQLNDQHQALESDIQSGKGDDKHYNTRTQDVHDEALSASNLDDLATDTGLETTEKPQPSSDVEDESSTEARVSESAAPASPFADEQHIEPQDSLLQDSLQQDSQLQDTLPQDTHITELEAPALQPKESHPKNTDPASIERES